MIEFSAEKMYTIHQVMSVKEAASQWNFSERWVQKLCAEGRIEGRFGRSLQNFQKSTQRSKLLFREVIIVNNIERRDKGLAYISDDTIMAEQAKCRKILQKLNFMDRSDFAGIVEVVK